MKLNHKGRREIRFMVLVFFLISLIIILSKANNLYQIDVMKKMTNEIFEYPFQASYAASETKNQISRMHRHLDDIVLSDSKRELNYHLSEIARHENQINTYLSLIQEKCPDKQSKNLVHIIQNELQYWNPFVKQITQLVENGNRTEANKLKSEEEKHIASLTKAVSQLQLNALHEEKRFQNRVNSVHDKFFTISIIVGIALLSLLFVIAYYTVTRVAGYILRTAHLTDVLSIIRDINQLIIRENEPKILMQRICESLITNRIYTNAWIALYDKSGHIDYIAVADGSDAFLTLKENIEHGWLPPCINNSDRKNGIPILIEKTKVHCPDCPLSDQYGQKGAFSTPLLYNGHAYGNLTLSLDTGYLIDEDEIALLQEVAGDIAYALYHLETEKQLQEHENSLLYVKELYENVINSVKNLIFVKDIDFTYIVCNQAFEKFVGKSNQEIVGKTDYDLFDKEVADFFREHDIKILEEKKSRSNFEWITYPDETKAYILTTKSPLCDSNGNLLGLVGNSVDMTEEKKIKDALETSNDKFQKAFNQTPNMIIMTNVSTGNIYDINATFEQLTGYSRDEIIGKTVWDIRLWRDNESRNNFLQLLNDKGMIKGEKYTFLTKNNSPLITRVYASFVTINNEQYILAMGDDITEEEKAKEALIESEERFKLMMHQSPSIIELYDLQGTQIEVNRAYEELWGFESERTVNKFNLFKSNEVAKTGLLSYVKQAYMGENVQLPPYEYDPSGPTEAAGIGRKRWLSTRMYPLKGISGEIKNIVITHEDITDTIHSREELKQSQENYRLLADNALDLIWKMDMELTFTYVNPAVKKLFGYEANEVIGTKLYQHCSQAQFETIQALVSEMLRTNSDEGASLEANLYKKDGSEIPLEINGKIIFDDSHTPIGFQGSARDFTVQTQARQELQNALNELERKSLELQTVLEEAPNPIMLHNEAGEVLMVNKVWEDSTGYKYDEINTIEKWTQKACNKKSLLKEQNAETLYSIDKKTNLGENVITSKDGHEMIWQVSSAPLGIINGKRTIVTSAMDVTEIKKKDEMMMAQSRHAAMGEMIGMIAHQWRQPIASIAMDANNMLLDIAFETFDNTSAAEYTQDILDQTNHLSKTIDDFRNFFKPDKAVSAVKLESIFEETLGIVKESLASHTITLKTSYLSETLVNAFPRELMQVFVNIINNAKDSLVSKNTPNALIEIKVYDEEKYVCAEICDNGGGIDAAIMPKIFDPYFSTKDEKTGTGLGLYMSKMIIEEHLHGFIEASNNKDGGACFTIRLLKSHETDHQAI